MDARVLIERFFDELGADVGELARDPEVYGWINSGQDRLPCRNELSTTLSWSAGATGVDLPADYQDWGYFVCDEGKYLPSHKRWGKRLVFPVASALAGSGTLYYFGAWPQIGDSQASILPGPGNVAVVAYAHHRFFRKLAASRSDFRRYATVTGQSGLDVSDLDALAERYRQDYLDAREEMEELYLAEPATFFGD